MVFNSALLYETALLKPYVQPLLFGVPRDSEEYVEAKRLLKFLDYFLPIPGGRRTPDVAAAGICGRRHLQDLIRIPRSDGLRGIFTDSVKKCPEFPGKSIKKKIPVHTSSVPDSVREDAYGRKCKESAFRRWVLRHAGSVPCHCGRLRLAAALRRRGTWLDRRQVTPQLPVSQPVEMPEKTVEQPVETLKPEPAVQEAASEPPAADPAPAAAEAPRLIVEPLRGEVLTAFSMEELVYNQTLGDWRTHDGVDIAARLPAAASAGGLRRDGTGRDGGSPAGNHCGAGP